MQQDYQKSEQFLIRKKSRLSLNELTFLPEKNSKNFEENPKRKMSEIDLRHVLLISKKKASQQKQINESNQNEKQQNQNSLRYPSLSNRLKLYNFQMCENQNKSKNSPVKQKKQFKLKSFKSKQQFLPPVIKNFLIKENIIKQNQIKQPEKEKNTLNKMELQLKKQNNMKNEQNNLLVSIMSQNLPQIKNNLKINKQQKSQRINKSQQNKKKKQILDQKLLKDQESQIQKKLNNNQQKLKKIYINNLELNNPQREHNQVLAKKKFILKLVQKHQNEEICSSRRQKKQNYFQPHLFQRSNSNIILASECKLTERRLNNFTSETFLSKKINLNGNNQQNGSKILKFMTLNNNKYNFNKRNHKLNDKIAGWDLKNQQQKQEQFLF